MAITTRCNRCRTKIDHMTTYCDRCKSIVGKEKREARTKANKDADRFTNTSRWRSLKADIKRRDKGVCKLCLLNQRVEYKALEVHHIHKRAQAPALAYEPNNLVTVCRSCHNMIEDLPVRKQFELVKMDYIEAEEQDNGLIFYL